MMNITLIFALAVVAFCSIIQFIVFVEVILSWSILLIGRPIRIGFISNIVEPMADAIANIVPSRFGMIDLSRLYIMLACQLIIVVASSLEPAVSLYIPR